MKSWLLVCGCVWMSMICFAQEDEFSYYEEDSVNVFFDGFYPTIDAFKNNDPIRPDQVISTVKTIHPNYFEEILSKPGFRYTENDTIKSAATDNLFGYCKNGDPYMNMGNGIYAKMATVGTICFIPVKMAPTVQPSVGFGASSWGGAGMGVGFNVSNSAPSEYILHTELEKAGELTPEQLMAFMGDDSELVEEFSALKRREQRKQVYAFIQKYNKRHPFQ